MKRVLYLMAYSLGAAYPVAGAELAADLSGIRDIHAVLPRNGLPPFVVSAIVILLGIAYAVSRSFRKNPAVILPERILSSPSDSLQELRISFERGEIPVSTMCEQLAQLLKIQITSDNNPALTSYEVIDAATGNMPIVMLNRAAGLFEFCDMVRFGGDIPGRASALKILDEARLIFNKPAENGP